MSDALKIAKWRWPKSVWDWTVYDDGSGAINREHKFDAQHHGDVHEVELVLIERGLAEQYGLYLLAELFGRAGVALTDLPDRATRIATAPLDARIRALVAVIDAQPKPT